MSANDALPQANAAELIKRLAERATETQVVDLETEGLGDGLPSVVPVLWNHKDQRVIPVKAEIEQWRQRPERAVGTARVDTLASFVDLLNRHKTEHAAIFARAQWPKPSLTAVIDYHKLDHEPAWGRHRILYEFPLTEEFTTWVENNGTAMSQLDFAQFLEDHAPELAAPTDDEARKFGEPFKERFGSPAELITLSRGLEVFVGARVKRQERLQSGERVIEFTSENRDAQGNQIDVPGVFMISLPPFVDGAPVRIPARLRYRAGQGDVTWSYQLYRWEFWLREQVKGDMQRAAGLTELPAYEGAPEMSAAT